MTTNYGTWGPERWNAFRDQLEKAYVWPSLYVFKFIVPRNRAGDVKALFPMHISSEKASRNGNFTSITFEMMMPGSEAVIGVYQRVRHIEGLIAL